MLVTRPIDGTGTYQDLSGRHFLERRLEAMSKQSSAWVLT